MDAARTVDRYGAIRLLTAALELVTCRPFAGRRFYGAKGSSWEWLEHDYLETDVLVRIVDAAEALAELGVATGDPGPVLWACDKARLIDAHREATHLLRMRAYALLGDRDSLIREARHAHQSATMDDPFIERSANVDHLLELLEAQLAAAWRGAQG